MNIEKLDRIVLTYEQYESINKWVEEHKPDKFELPFNEALLILQGIEGWGVKADLGIHFKAEENGNAHFKVFDMSDMHTLVSFNADEDLITSQRFKITSHGGGGDKTAQGMATSIFLITKDIFSYITNSPQTVVTEQELRQIKKTQKSKKKTSNNKNRYVKIKTTKYTFDFERGDADKREYERKADAWTVRGHWRHIKKSGKMVWIKGHKKGSGETEGKIYKL